MINGYYAIYNEKKYLVFQKNCNSLIIITGDGMEKLNDSTDEMSQLRSGFTASGKKYYKVIYKREASKQLP